MNASDIVYSFERVVSSPHSKYSNLLLETVGMEHKVNSKGEYVPGSLGIKAKDEKTVEMRFERTFHALLEVLANTPFSIVPEGIVGDIEGYSGLVPYEKFESEPVGCGPFKIKEWEKGEVVAFERFEGYHNDVAKVAGLNYKVFTDSEEAHRYSMEKKTDNVDFPYSRYDPSKIKIKGEDPLGRPYGTYKLENGENLDYYRTPVLSTSYIGFNMLEVPKDVRKATAYITDQPKMGSDLRKGRVSPAYLLTPPGIYPGGGPIYEEKAREEYPYGHGKNAFKIDEARKILEEPDTARTTDIA